MATDRTMISRTEFATTKAGRPVAQLFSSDTRLQFPVMVVFDLAMLADVDIDPQSEKGTVIHKRYWATYTVSEKQTSRGNPYRDVTSLEPISTVQPEPGNIVPLLQEILDELTQIRLRLENTDLPAAEHTQSQPAAVAEPQAPPPAPDADVDDGDPFAGVDLPDEPLDLPEEAGCAPAENAAPIMPEATPPAASIERPAQQPNSQGQRLSMNLFYQLAGPAIAAGHISHRRVNDLATGANGSGWISALAALQSELETPQP
jgi:hypothetical protein